MYDIDFRALPTVMLYYIADECKAMALSCDDPRLLHKAKAIEDMAGQREIGASMLDMEVCA